MFLVRLISVKANNYLTIHFNCESFWVELSTSLYIEKTLSQYIKLNMKKFIPIYIYGAIKIFVGIFLLFFEKIPFNTIKFTLGISLIVGAIFAIIPEFYQQKRQVQFAYHKMHALAMFIYGVSVLLFCNSPERIMWATAFLLFFYAFSEITFCNLIFNLEQKVVFKIVLIRIILGFLIGIGTIVAIQYEEFTLQVFGAMFILVGLNIVFYVPVMKANLK